MPALTLAPIFSAFARFDPPPFRTLLRSTAYKLNPPRPQPYHARVTRARDAVLASGRGDRSDLTTILCESRLGSRPTIVLGGFVPDATEQMFLMRTSLLKHGSVYYLNYPCTGFSLDLLCAQLDDLVEELAHRRGQQPVIFGVSFGAGVVTEWLRRSRAAGTSPALGGIILVSPVGCTADIVDPAEAKPSTLLGRALKPYLSEGTIASAATVEKSRVIFQKMFEAGAQNKASLRLVLTPGELLKLRDDVLGTIAAIEAVGASERVQAMRAMQAPTAWTGPSTSAVLSTVPTLILYAEKESSVLNDRSPTRQAFEQTLQAIFPRGDCRVVSGGVSPVQHASLIFHYFQFLPPVEEFYRELRTGNFRLAA